MTKTALEQLKQAANWVCHTPDKMPVDPKCGRLAKAGQPETWGTYEQALAYKGKHHDFVAGIGRELDFDEGLVFIDLDKCRNPRTGAVTPLAARVLNSISSYAEVSPSGTGIHILAYGDIPGSLGPDPDATVENRVEMYKERRYFTWTGKQVQGAPSAIQNAFLSIYRLYWEIKDVRLRRHTLPDTSSNYPGGSWTSIDPYVRTVLEKQCATVATCPQGSRHHTIYYSAYVLGQYVKHGLLEQGMVERELYIAGLACGQSHAEIVSAMRDGMKDGVASSYTRSSLLRIIEEAKTKELQTA